MSQKTRDQVLVQQSLSGDTSAYGILVDRYSSLVAGIARHYGAGCDAEDLVQDVFLQAWRNLPGLRNHNRFGPWIARIARNQGLMVPTTAPSPSRRRRVLGALAAAVLPLARSDAAVPAPPVPSRSIFAWDRGLLAGIALSAIIHLAVLELDPPVTPSSNPPARQVRLSQPLSRRQPNLPPRTGSVPELHHMVSPALAPLPEVALAPRLLAPRQPAAATARPLPSRSSSRKRSLSILQEMARLSIKTREVPETLELLRLQDFDRSGSKHAAVIIDSTDKQRLRGFVHFPPNYRLDGMGMGLSGRIRGRNTLAEVAQYMRMETGVEARIYSGNAWNNMRRYELLEYPILFSFSGSGPFWQTDWWRQERRLPLRLAAEESDALGRYLRGGGFLVIEGGHRYLESMAAQVRRALNGDGRIIRLPFDHAIYHSYYNFKDGYPGEYRTEYSELRSQDPWYFPSATSYFSSDGALWGVEIDGELVVLLSPQRIFSLEPPPLHGGSLHDQHQGVVASPKTPWLRAATNIVVYALTRDGGLTHRREPGLWTKLANK